MSKHKCVNCGRCPDCGKANDKYIVIEIEDYIEEGDDTHFIAKGCYCSFFSTGCSFTSEKEALRYAKRLNRAKRRGEQALGDCFNIIWHLERKFSTSPYSTKPISGAEGFAYDHYWEEYREKTGHYSRKYLLYKLEEIWEARREKQFELDLK